MEQLERVSPQLKPKNERTQKIEDLIIDEVAMKALKFNIRMTRDRRRKIARENKMDWKVYRFIEKEVARRINNNLSIYTGKAIENEQN